MLQKLQSRFAQAWKLFLRINPWAFLALAIISGVVCVFALRANNLHMRDLREAVFTADREGKDVQTPLKELQGYVTRHMNTNLSSGKTSVYPPIQLQYTYQRLVEQHSQQTGQGNTQMYNEAQKYCEGQNSADFSGRNRVPCIQQYVQSHTAVQSSPIPDALYKFAFVSPRWSPDFAGLSMLVAILSLVLFVFLLLARKFLRH